MDFSPHADLPQLPFTMTANGEWHLSERTLVDLRQFALVAIICGFVLGLAFPKGAVGETITVDPTGEYAQIDTRIQSETGEILSKGTPEEKDRAIERVLAKPENYAPPIFYVLSHALFAKDRKDEAAFWFYAGQLRARFDVNRCADASASGAVSALNAMYGPLINRYSFGDLDKLEKLVPRVVEWDRKTPHNYDHRWINLHGMGAMNEALGNFKTKRDPLSRPIEEWEKIAENTRTEYYRDFQDGIALAKNGIDNMGQFRIRNDEVFFRNVKVTGADAATFRWIGDGYGKDKDHAYFAWDTVNGADTASFKVLGDSVAKDSKSVYSQAEHCESCDAQSFRSEAEQWYTDKNAAYFGQGLQRIPGIDQQSFKVFNATYAKDRQTVLAQAYKVVGADPETFKLQSCEGSEVNGEDKNRCYWNEHAVPCDCKSHSMDDFPWGLTPLPANTSLLDTTAPIRIKLIKGDYAKGYSIVPAGQQTIELGCWNSNTNKDETYEFGVVFTPGHLYRLQRLGSEGCAVKVENPAFVRGNLDRPEIRIEVPGGKKPEWQVELASGKQKLTAICREVTRERVVEVPVELTLELEPGGIYQLSANFDASQSRCDVKAVRLPQG
jgi:hypothetical protein